MYRGICLLLLFLFVAISCTRQDTSLSDALNHRAYDFRYVNVDTSLHYAEMAYKASGDYPDGQAEAINHRAFVYYQQMRFSKAMAELDSACSITNNQVELLCVDVLRMKITQRTGDLRTFYRAWHSAECRLQRIDEELHLLSPHHQQRVLYARTEMYIIGGTYYYYSRQDSAYRAEIHQLDSYMQLPLDTAQWCSYMYLIGAGGVLDGDSLNIRLKEFDNLTHVLTLTRRRRDMYFHANTLQALALALESSEQRELIRKYRGGGMDFIVGQYANATIDEDFISLALAEHSLELFREYGDRFQTANVLRTKAELLFRKERFSEALVPLTEALDIVSEQHKIESKQVPYWEASIHERLSLTYSALGNHLKAKEHRDAYLSFLEAMRQDREEDIREAELNTYNKRLYINLFIVAAMLLALSTVFAFLFRKVKKHTLRQEREAEDMLQLTKDETRAREMQLSREKLDNLERRAKVSLVENVVPYINRMLHTDDMEYVAELSAEIMRINDVLTEWIQVRRGTVAMNISTFALQPLLNTLALNKSTYERKGLEFNVPSTACLVKADRALTLFMINTLCDNARKFTQPGGRVSIVVDETEKVVEISVVDTGCGLEKEDVDKINNSKVFRISHTSASASEPLSSEENKGFGFGLMNCKGIIGQMKKQSSRFECCDFGVESVKGKGSRFWFRLPRVIAIVAGLLVATLGISQERSVGQLAVYNRDGMFEEVIALGDSLLDAVPKDSIRLHFMIENEMSMALQSLGRGEEYRQHTAQCLRLPRIMTSDPGLPVYAKRLHTLKSEISGTLFLTLFLLICSLFLLFFAVRRSRRRRDLEQKVIDMRQEQMESLNRIQYELDRIHIQNQILDNCLSTIKHETMYYPARINVLSTGKESKHEDLSQLMSYYYDIYTILLGQAQRQLHASVSMDETVLYELKRRIMCAISDDSASVHVYERGNIQEVRIRPNKVQIPTNLFTPEAANLDAFVAREIVRMHDAACGYPGLRLYVENNEIIITLWKNSRLLSSKTFSWN